MRCRFGRFQLDTDEFRLSADGEPVSLEPKALLVLGYLVARQGKLVRKQELLDALWPDTAVTQNALTRAVTLLRRVLEDDSRSPEFIETVPRIGYRFCAAVTIAALDDPSATDARQEAGTSNIVPEIRSHGGVTADAIQPSMRRRAVPQWRNFVFRGLAIATTMSAVFAGWQLIRHHGSASAASLVRREGGTAATPASGPRSNEEARAAAQEECRRGYFYFDRRNILASETAFRHAVELDPDSSSAYAGLSQALLSRALFATNTSLEAVAATVSDGEDAARKAITLDPANGKAYLALGTAQMNFTWQWREAEQNLTHGLQLSPDDAVGNMQYAMYLSGSGRTEEALQHIRHAVEVDPLSFFMVRQEADVLYMGHRFDEALVALEHAKEMAPPHPNVVDNWIACVDESKGLYDQAIEHDMLFLREQITPQELVRLQAAYRDGGWKGYWTIRLDQMRVATQRGCGLYTAGTAYIKVGDRDRAFDALTKAAEQHCFWLNQVRVDPALDAIRQDPRFPQLLSLVDPHTELGRRP